MGKTEIIVAIIVAVISSGLINTLIASKLYKKQLEEDRKKRVGEMIDEKILEALLESRRLIEKVFMQEILNFKKKLENEKVVNMFGNHTYYPAIMNTRDSLNNFATDVRNFRIKYDLYINVEIGLNIAFINHYIHQLMAFSGSFGDERVYPYIGAIAILDLQKWASQFDRLVVNEINKRDYHLESHHNQELWNQKRKDVIEKRWSETLLNIAVEKKTPAAERKEDCEYISNVLKLMIQDLSLQDSKAQTT